MPVTWNTNNMGVPEPLSSKGIRCSTCSEWHHRPCVNIYEGEDQSFVCQRCDVEMSLLEPNQSDLYLLSSSEWVFIHPLYSLQCLLPSTPGTPSCGQRIPLDWRLFRLHELSDDVNSQMQSRILIISRPSSQTNRMSLTTFLISWQSPRANCWCFLSLSKNLFSFPSRIEPLDVVNRVSELFTGHPALIQGFNTFVGITMATPTGKTIQSTNVNQPIRSPPWSTPPNTPHDTNYGYGTFPFSGLVACMVLIIVDRRE